MWKDKTRVKYISPSGHQSIKRIEVTAEGFAAIIDNGREILFDSHGSPLNTILNQDTGGPSIQCIQTTPKNSNNNHNNGYATFENPWDNNFALDSLTIFELNKLTKELINIGLGTKKLNLKNFSRYATLENKNKIKKIFSSSRENRGDAKQ